MADNLSKKLQIFTTAQKLSAQKKHPTLWKFKQLDTLRKEIVQRVGRIIRSQGKLMSLMVTNNAVKDEMLHYPRNRS